jgi:hypothetical protein
VIFFLGCSIERKKQPCHSENFIHEIKDIRKNRGGKNSDLASTLLKLTDVYLNVSEIW